MATRKTSTKAPARSTAKAAARSSAAAKTGRKASSRGKTSAKTTPSTRGRRSAVQSPMVPAPLQPMQVPLAPAPAYTPVTLSEHSPELRSEIAELRGQLQALVANLGTRQPVMPATPQVLMLQPMGMGMGAHDDWQARHDLTHERDDLRKKIQAQELTIAQLEQALAEGQTALQAESDAKVQAQQQIQALSKAQADLTNRLNAETQAKQTAAAERDAQARLAQERAATMAQLQKELADTKAARDAEAKAKQAAQTERDSLQQRIQQHEAQQKELQEEGELLLTQLHQVQEELERYFLDAQALKQDKEQLQQRVSRLLKRLPGTVEWDDLAAEANKTSLTLTLQQVVSADRQVPQLKLVLSRHKKQLTLQVVDAEGQPPALLHGPLALPINPAAIADSAEAAALAQLAPSDITLLQQVCTSVAPALPAPMAGRDKWAADLTLLAEQLKTLPPVWRYDAVSLRHEQVNPDYEHLWFHFDNATFGSRHWPSFEFRLSAANVRKGKFSQHPKLEFPDPGPGLPKQFENWFEESEDDHGVKYELRFDLRKNIMDLAAWQALGKEDQDQMRSLLTQLDRVMGEFEKNGIKISRSWSEWRDFLQATQTVMKTQLNTH